MESLFLYKKRICTLCCADSHMRLIGVAAFNYFLRKTEVFA